VDCIRIQHPEMAMPAYQAPIIPPVPGDDGDGKTALVVPSSNGLNDEIPF